MGPDPIGLGVLLFLPYRHLEQRVISAVRRAGHPITLAQARVFQRVEEAGSRLTTLAESAQVTKQTAGFLVDQLQREGYVERRADPVDARARLVCTTARGRAAIAVARTVEAEVYAEWEAHLGPARTAELRVALESLRQITDPYA